MKKLDEYIKLFHEECWEEKNYVKALDEADQNADVIAVKNGFIKDEEKDESILNDAFNTYLDTGFELGFKCALDVLTNLLLKGD